MQLSASVTTPRVNYKVGTGTTVFANITKNAAYFSCNSVIPRDVRDASHIMVAGLVVNSLTTPGGSRSAAGTRIKPTTRLGT